MLTTAIAFVLETLFGLFILAALVRFWMQAFRVPSRNPIAQFTMALTDWAVKPLRRKSMVKLMMAMIIAIGRIAALVSLRLSDYDRRG